jgi:hypothetical protein
MAKKMLVVVTIALLLALPNAAAAIGKLTVAQETFLVLPYQNYYYAMLCAEVENTGDKPVQFNSGLLEIFDPEDNPIASVTLSDYCFPPVLDPGAHGFLFTSQYFREVTDKGNIADYSLSVTGQGAITYNITRFPFKASYETKADGNNTYDYVIVMVENNTEDIAYDIKIPYALKDADGKLLYVNYTQLYGIGLYPHSSLEIRLQLDSAFVASRMQAGITPAGVEAMAYTQAYK